MNPIRTWLWLWYIWFASKLYRALGTAMGPVSFTWSSSVPAGAIYLPLDGWQYEFAPFNGAIEVIADATAIGMVLTLTSAGDTIVEESPIKAGGVSGVIPSALNTPVYVGAIKKSERLKVKIRNTSGGAVITNGIATLVPGRGR